MHFKRNKNRFYTLKKRNIFLQVLKIILTHSLMEVKQKWMCNIYNTLNFQLRYSILFNNLRSTAQKRKRSL